MFTGIIESIGIVHENRNGRLVIEVDDKIAKDVKDGSSVAINGVCLTVIQNKKSKCKMLSFDVVPETLRKTDLGLLEKGAKVNLERALKVGSRFEGHVVEGHVDQKSKVKSQKVKVTRDGRKDRIISIQIPKGLGKYIVPKGSVAVDGMSLTVVYVTKKYFTVAIIPHTFESTIVQYYKEGTAVNIEVDMIAKYVEKLFFVIWILGLI